MSLTFSPVVKPTTIWVVLTLAFFKGWILRLVDVNNAFLDEDLTKDIFMAQPPSFKHGHGLVCKMKKALYGLKQASNA